MAIKINYAGCAVAFLSFPFTLSTSLPAIGQDLVLEEIVVTARKREESLQETPVAVSAYTGRSLSEAGIDSLDDLNAIVPGIDLAAGNGVSGKANIYIRGIGQRNTGPQIDSGVGIYLDGIYLSRADGALLDVNDIASIQVLRGPQGTLFGKNTTGGAIVFNSNRPNEEFQGSVMVRAGNFDRRDGSGMINIPLSDTVFTRLSATAIRRDGHMHNLTTGVNHNDEDRLSALWQLRWEASENLTADLNAVWTKTQQNSRGQQCQPVEGIDGWQAPGFNALLANTANPTTVDELCDISVNAGEYDWTGDEGRSTRYIAETMGASLTLDWAINDELSFKSVTGWRESEGGTENDLDPTSAVLIYQSEIEHPEARPLTTTQITQELQLTGSAGNGKFDYVVGAFYFDEKTDERTQISEVASAQIPVLPGLFSLGSQRTEILAENSAWAVYSQLDWNITDNWRLTVGGRYTSEDRELFRARSNLDPNTLSTAPGTVLNIAPNTYLLPPPGELNRAWGFFDPQFTEQEVSASKFTPMVSLQYLFEGAGFIDSGSVYFTYSEGFLSGGLSEAPRVLTDADGNPILDDNGNPIPGAFDEFQPEEVKNYELGVKIDAWDQRLRVNAAAFYSDYKNRQLTTIVINPVLGSPAGATFNAPKSTISGIEIETTLLPFGQLELTMNASFFKGEIDEYDDIRLSLADVPAGMDCVADDIGVLVGPACVVETPIDRSDEDLPRLPARTFYVAGQYRFIGDYGTIVPRLQYSKKFDVERCFERGSCESGLWNSDEPDLSARISWFSPNERYRVSVYGNNLTDERTVIGGQPLVDSFGFGGVTFNAPRLYGVELEASF